MYLKGVSDLKLNNYEFFEKMIAIFSLIIVVMLWILKLYYSNFVAIMVMVLNIYMVVKSRKNVYGFFLFLSIAYFDYSVIFSKYLFRLPNFNWIFHYIMYDDTLFVGIAILYIFHAVLFLFIRKEFYDSKSEIFLKSFSENNQNKKKTNLLMLILILLIAIILVDCLFFHILFKLNSVYEYLIIPMVIVIFYSRNRPLIRKIVLIVIVVSAVVCIYGGDRVTSLSPIIAYFFINYNKKINYRNIFFILISGVFAYTLFGTYGDLLVQNKDLSSFKIQDYNNKMIDNMFTIDTSYSAYWTGLTFIETRNIVSNSECVDNFVQYITKYTLLGSISNYKVIQDISKNYYPHWGGGYITSCFYYWLGIFGVLLVALYITYLINKFSMLEMESSDYSKIVFIYFISTVPRWYLYYPTSIIRGLLLLSVVYFIVNIFIKHSSKQVSYN